MKGESPFDLWSLVHFAAGWALSVTGINLVTALTILVGYEAFEMQLRKVPASESGGEPGGFVKGLLEFESQQNIIADIAMGLAGFLLGRHTR